MCTDDIHMVHMSIHEYMHIIGKVLNNARVMYIAIYLYENAG